MIGGGIAGRTRLATMVKSGLSMITRMSGAASRHCRGLRISRKSFGRSFTTPKSHDRQFSIGNSEPVLRAPSTARRRLRTGPRRRAAGATPSSVGASRSPDSSVAIRNTFRRHSRCWRRITRRPVTKRLAASAARPRLRVDHDGIAGDDRNPGKLGRAHPRRFAAHRREIEAQILPALGCLHQCARADLARIRPSARSRVTRASKPSVPSISSTPTT